MSDTHSVIYVHIYIAIQKFGKAPGKEGFGQHHHKSLLFCDDSALIRDNTKYVTILLNKK